MSARELQILVLLLCAQFMLAVDFSILNVALPTIGASFDFSLANLQWIATAFALCAAGFTLFFGRVADIVGRRRMFLFGMFGLGVSSLAGGLADSQAFLLVARTAQGIATAIVTPAALSLLTSSFPEGPKRNKALGMNGAIMSSGFTVGAVLGGFLLDLFGWRWLFFINVPIALIVLVATPMIITADRPGAKKVSLDIAGAAFVTLAILACIFGVTEIGERGLQTEYGFPMIGAGVVLFILFWLVEKYSRNPLVPLQILKRKSVIFGNLAGLIAFATETSLVFLMTIYMQKVLGYSGIMTGLVFGVLGAGTVSGGFLAPTILGRFKNRGALLIGFIVQALATAALIFLGLSTATLPLLLIATFIGGVGNMVAIVGFMTTATSGLPNEEQGLATGLATLTQQFGITIGIPIMSTFMAYHMGPSPRAVAAPADVLLGISFAVTINTLMVVAGAVLALFYSEKRPAKARRDHHIEHCENHTTKP